MSTLYQSSKDVPTEVLATRLNELADVVAQKRDRIGAEFTMRIPAECDRDADLVMAEAARRLSAAPDVQREPALVAWVLFDATADQKYIKMNDRDGSLAFFDSEAAAQRAKHLAPGTDYERCEYYATPQPAEQQPAPDVAGLVEAAQRVLDGLNARIDSAAMHGGTTPVFDGIANLHDALAAHRKQGGGQ